MTLIEIPSILTTATPGIRTAASNLKTVAHKAKINHAGAIRRVLMDRTGARTIAGLIDESSGNSAGDRGPPRENAAKVSRSWIRISSIVIPPPNA
jgi:hypothetical protein